MSKAKRWKRLSLNDLSIAVTGKEKINISNQDIMSANKITIIKRDGRTEPFNPGKLKKMALWACENNEYMTEELIRDTEIKLHKEIRITDMYQQLIITAVNKISMLQPIWEDVSAKLQLMSIYKETYNISKENEYPSLLDVLLKGVEHKIYDKKTISKYTLAELEELNSAIDPKRDILFNYKGLVTFFDKYCLNYTKLKNLNCHNMLI